jgi:K+-transporting ATPase KdpF subunit
MCWILSCSQLASASLRSRSVTPSLVIGYEEARMIFDYTLASVVTVGLMVYLTYALLRPERF